MDKINSEYIQSIKNAEIPLSVKLCRLWAVTQLKYRQPLGENLLTL